MIYFQMADPLSSDIKQLLDQQQPGLMKMVKPSSKFWALLRKYAVLLKYQVEEIKVSSFTSIIRSKIMRHIEQFCGKKLISNTIWLGRGGLQNGKIVGPKLFAPPPQDRLKMFTPPLSKSGNFLCPHTIWLKLQATA